MKFIDISWHNVGGIDSTTGKYKAFPFNWEKAKSQGVEGAIIKSCEGLSIDSGFDLSMSTCNLPFRGVYGYVKYTQKAYPIDGEVAWGRKLGQVLLETAYKYFHNIRVTIDLEQNYKWEKLVNTSTDQALNRALTITYYMVDEINRLAKYLPIIYVNKYLTRHMKNFTGCPLLIATGSMVPPRRFEMGDDSCLPGFYNWKEAAGVQYDWLGSGKLYGNYVGNPYIDLDEIYDVNKILVPGAAAFGIPVTEDEVAQPKPLVVKITNWIKGRVSKSRVNLVR